MVKNKAKLAIGARAGQDQEREELKEWMRTQYREGKRGFSQFITIFEHDDGPDDLADMLRDVPALRPLVHRLLSFTFFDLLLSITNERGELVEADGTEIPKKRKQRDLGDE